MKSHFRAALAALFLITGAVAGVLPGGPGASRALGALGTLAALGGPTAAHAAEKGLCIVCHVKDGTDHLEPVTAERTYDGVRYVFCNDTCAKEFDADPIAFVPPKFPRAAPEIALEDLSGAPLSNETLKGRVVLVDFWATWCVPCRKSMPELQALHDKYDERGFGVVGISIDEDGPAKVKKFVASKKIRYPIALDTAKSPVWDRFHVKSVPAAFLLDRDGRIVAQWTGVPVDAKELETKLAGLLPKAD